MSRARGPAITWWSCAGRLTTGHAGHLSAKKDRKRNERQNYDNQRDGRIPVHKGGPAVLHDAAMTTLELDDGEKAAMAELLKRTIASDPFPDVPAHSDAAHNPRQAGAGAGTTATAPGT